MKMIRAILRPETTDEVTEELAAAGFFITNKNKCIWPWETEGDHSRNDTL